LPFSGRSGSEQAAQVIPLPRPSSLNSFAVLFIAAAIAVDFGVARYVLDAAGALSASLALFARPFR
jgi:hypothetical protein